MNKSRDYSQKPEGYAILEATLTREAFTVNFCIAEPTLAECHATLAKLIKKMKFPRRKSLMKPMSIVIHRADEGVKAIEEAEEHRRELEAYAQTQHLPGTQAMFKGVNPDLPVVELDKAPARPAAQKPRKAPRKPAKAKAKPAKRKQAAKVKPLPTAPKITVEPSVIPANDFMARSCQGFY